MNVLFSGDRCNKTQEEGEKTPITKGNRFLLKVTSKLLFFSLYTVTLSLDFVVI